MGGEEGYVNVVQTLNDISYSYVNKEYAIGGRSVGYSLDGLSEEEITNYKVIDTKVYPLGIVSDFPYIDYQLDTSELSATGIDLGDEIIWLASRYLDEYDDTTRFFMIRWMSDGEYCDYDCMIDNSGGESSASYGVRPVVSLKSGLTVTGSGTKADPYVINTTNPSQYTVTYSANGGYGEMVPQSVAQGDSLTLSTNTYEHHNAIFMGWSTSASATTAIYTDGQTITPTADMTLYAVWVETVAGKVSVGDYITYVPSSTSYTVPTTVSGYTDNQTFNPSSTTSWRVFSNDGENVEIISTNSVGKLYLKGSTGYTNLVQTLNDMSVSYVNPQYAISGRSLGYYDEKVVSSDGTLGDDMTEEQKANYRKLDTSKYPLNYGVSGLQYEDHQYKLDESILSAHAGLYHSSGYIWLANRSIITQGGGTNFRSYDISNTGYVSCDLLCGSGSTSYSVSNGVRPIVTLKSALAVTGGSGTSSDPYTINESNPSQYTVTYSANGGYGEMVPQSVAQGGSLTLNTNTYEHHSKSFVGWSTDATATTVTYTDGQSITPTEDMTLYAVWSNKITVVELGNGTVSPGTIVVAEGEEQVFTMTPDDGWEIGNIIVDDILVGEPKICTFESDDFYTISSDSQWIKSGDSFVSDSGGEADSIADSTISFTGNGYLSFDYSVSSEENYDKLTIIVESLNGTQTVADEISGTQSGSFHNWVSGDVTITLTYSKDNSVNTGDDCGKISNLQYCMMGNDEFEVYEDCVTFTNVTGSHTLTVEFVE